MGQSKEKCVCVCARARGSDGGGQHTARQYLVVVGRVPLADRVAKRRAVRAAQQRPHNLGKGRSVHSEGRIRGELGQRFRHGERTRGTHLLRRGGHDLDRPPRHAGPQRVERGLEDCVRVRWPHATACVCARGGGWGVEAIRGWV